MTVRRLCLATFVTGLVALAAVLAVGSGSTSPTKARRASGELLPRLDRRSPLILAPTEAPLLTSSVQREFARRWPLVIHQGGAYAVFPHEAAAFTRAGLTLALTNHIEPDGPVRYVDPRVTNLEEQYFGRYRCNHHPAPCPVSQPAEQAFLAAVGRELRKQHDNPNVVAYYIMDDYIGNLAGVLAKVHAMVAADNRTLAHPRPTICGFGGSLNFHTRNLPAGRYEDEYASLGHYVKLELLNFTPGACDMVQFYVYSLSHRAPISDYSMRSTMPEMLAELRLRGWDPALTPIIGSPQAWEGTPPSAAEIRQQTAAFCAYGAQSVIAFTWRNFPPAGPKAEPELANRACLRAGLAEGLSDCRTIWAGNSGSVNRDAATISVPPRIRPAPLAAGT